MIEFLIVYFLIGGFISSMLMWLASKHPFYRPTTIAWIVILFVWPYALIKFLWRYLRG